jgi:hypothetical protein
MSGLEPLRGLIGACRASHSVVAIEWPGADIARLGIGDEEEIAALKAELRKLAGIPVESPNNGVYGRSPNPLVTPFEVFQYTPRGFPVYVSRELEEAFDTPLQPFSAPFREPVSTPKVKTRESSSQSRAHHARESGNASQSRAHHTRESETNSHSRTGYERESGSNSHSRTGYGRESGSNSHSRTGYERDAGSSSQSRTGYGRESGSSSHSRTGYARDSGSNSRSRTDWTRDSRGGSPSGRSGTRDEGRRGTVDRQCRHRSPPPPARRRETTRARRGARSSDSYSDSDAGETRRSSPGRSRREYSTRRTEHSGRSRDTPR